jgi:hypothetical protein
MRSPAINVVTVAIPADVEKKGEGANEHVQEHRRRTNLGHGNGNSSWPTVAHLWAGTDVRRVGMQDPSVDLQPDNSLLAARSPAPLNATSHPQQAPTLATLRRLKIRATPLSGRNVGGRIPEGMEGPPCEKPDCCPRSLGSQAAEHSGCGVRSIRP